jgi:hypothetical protein
MRLFSRFVSILGSGLVLVFLGAGVAHATTQEVFICTLNEGATLEQLMEVGSEFVEAAKDITGGKSYQAQILTPIASQNLQSVIWIGRMPDFTALAKFNDAYGATDVAAKLDAKFEALTKCESRSFWQVHNVQ